MLHFHYVGHFDPRDYVDTSEKPFRPKAMRLMSREAMDRVLSEFNPAIADYVWYNDDGGYVVCGWAQAPRWFYEPIHLFALALAESKGAVVMNERWLIEVTRVGPPACD